MNNFIAHILVVDDDDGIRSLVKQYLNKNNFLVTTSNSAESAQEKVSVIKFDLIILDVMMPGKTGLDFIKENKLKITKQSLNRVLKDLIKLEIIFFEKDQQDSRVKHIFLNNKGEKIFEEIFSTQKKRIYNALLNSSSDQVLNFDNVLKKIINE